MKNSYKLILLALIIITAMLVGCEPDEGSNPNQNPTPTPTIDPIFQTQNGCIQIDAPDPEMERAIRLTNTCDFEVNVKFCLDPDGNPSCNSPDEPALSPGEWTRAFPQGQEYAVKMGVCRAIDNQSLFYDPGNRAFRDGQTCEKKDS